MSKRKSVEKGASVQDAVSIKALVNDMNAGLKAYDDAGKSAFNLYTDAIVIGAGGRTDEIIREVCQTVAAKRASGKAAENLATRLTTCCIAERKVHGVVKRLVRTIAEKSNETPHPHALAAACSYIRNGKTETQAAARGVEVMAGRKAARKGNGQKKKKMDPITAARLIKGLCDKLRKPALRNALCKLLVAEFPEAFKKKPAK